MNRHESIMGAVAICAIVFAPATAAADCALMGLAPKVLSQPDTVLAPEGGFVVGAVSIDRGSLEDGDIATQVSWKIKGPKDSIVPMIETIAPGLAVYRANNV